MIIRKDPIYLSSEVWRWLRLLSKAEMINKPHGTSSVENYRVTPDEIADQILRQAIREQHPDLAEHEKQIDKLEKELIERLRTKHEDRTIPRSGSQGS